MIIINARLIGKLHTKVIGDWLVLYERYIECKALLDWPKASLVPRPPPSFPSLAVLPSFPSLAVRG